MSHRSRLILAATLVALLVALGGGLAAASLRYPLAAAAASPTATPAAISTPAPSLGEAPASALAVRTWKLVAFTFRGSKQDLAPGVTVTLRFLPKQQVAGGNAGCNSYGAFYTLTPARAQLLISGHYQTQMACLSAQRMQQEARYLSAFDHITTYHLNAAGLTLSDATGRFVLRYTS